MKNLAEQVPINHKQPATSYQLPTTNTQHSTHNTQHSFHQLPATSDQRLSPYFDFSKEKLILEKREDLNENLDLKKLYLEQKNILYGNVVHLYLSYIKYGHVDDHYLAHLNIIKQYGNILSLNELIEIQNQIKDFIIVNKHLFCNSYDKIFNEWTCFDVNNNQYRIDRLMINTKEKKALIIDYKTGGIADTDQITKYIEILKQMPAFDGYEIKGEFVAVL